MYCKHEAAFEQHQRDMVSLEALHTQLEQAQQFGSIDKPTQQLTALAYNKITSRYSDYGIESFEGDTVSLEKSDNVLTRMAKGVGKMLAAIWKKIMDFFRWIGGLLGFKSKSKKQITASISNDAKKVEAAKPAAPTGGMSAAANRSASDGQAQTPVPSQELEVAIEFATLATLDAIIEHMDGEEKAKADSSETKQERATKTYDAEELNELKQIFKQPKVDERVSIGSAGNVFGKEAADYDAEKLISAIEMASTVPLTLRESVIGPITSIVKLIEHRMSNPTGLSGEEKTGVDSLKDSNTKTAIHNVANSIVNYSTKAGNFTRTRYAGIPGLVLENKKFTNFDGPYTGPALNEWYGAADFKFSRQVGGYDKLTFACASIPQMERYTKQMAVDQSEYASANTKYLASISEFDKIVKKVSADESLASDPIIKWACAWATKLCRSVSIADTYALGVDKACEKYFATCYSVLTDKPLKKEKRKRHRR